MTQSLIKVGIAGALIFSPLLLPHLRAELPLPIIAILLLFVALPLFLLSLVDMSKTLREGPSGFFPRILRVIFSAEQVILGLLAVTFGVTIILWFVYNVFVERLPEFTGIDNFKSFGMAMALIAVGAYWLCEAFRKQTQYGK